MVCSYCVLGDISECDCPCHEQDRSSALARDAARWRAVAPALTAWVDAQRAYDESRAWNQGTASLTQDVYERARDAAMWAAFEAVREAKGGE